MPLGNSRVHRFRTIEVTGGQTGSIISPDGDAWVLNTGADEYPLASTLQGTVVRIQGETTGLVQTATTKTPLPFGTDDAVTVFAVGSPGDAPPVTINFDNEGDLWIGFHKAGSKYGYFQSTPTMRVTILSPQ